MRSFFFLLFAIGSFSCSSENPKLKTRPGNDEPQGETSFFSASVVEVKGELGKEAFTANTATLRDGTLRISLVDGVLSRMAIEVVVPEKLRNQKEIAIEVNSKQKWTEGIPTVVVEVRPVNILAPLILFDGYDLDLLIKTSGVELSGTINLTIEKSGTKVFGKFGK